MEITMQNVKKGIRFLKSYGVKELFVRLKEKTENENITYEQWQKRHKLTKAELSAQRHEKWEPEIRFDVVIVGDGENDELVNETRRSLETQSYTNWRFCEDFQGTLGWAVLLFVGDTLSPEALYQFAKRIQKEENADVIYADSDERGEPYFKPDFNLDLLRTHNYIGNTCVIRWSLLRYVLSAMELDSVADFTKKAFYEMIFHCVEEQANFVHVPKILIHENGAYASGDWNRQQAEVINGHLERCHVEAGAIPLSSCEACLVHYGRKSDDLISIIIPNKDEVESLKKCLASIERSTYRNYEVIIVENNSCEETFDYYRTIAPKVTAEGQLLEGQLAGGQRIAVAIWKEGFNYSKLNNFGVNFAKGTQYVFLNNDIEMLTKDWMEILLGHCQREEVGIAGIKLCYPDDTIQHAGIVVGIGGSKRGIASNMLVGLDRKEGGYRNKAFLQADYSAVTAACMMVTKTAYDEVKGFNTDLAVAFNDVDFCLKVRKTGKLVVFEPGVEAYHYESKSRGAEDTPEKVARFKREIDYMRNAWPKILEDGDPYYNPNFSKVYNRYSFGN